MNKINFVNNEEDRAKLMKTIGERMLSLGMLNKEEKISFGVGLD